MTTIYLSSTYEDLKDYRRVVLDDLRKAGYIVIAMEDYVAAGRRPVDECLADVARSDIYVGIFAYRYGYKPPADHNNPDDLSITELEFRYADEEAKIPCLTFVVGDEIPWPSKFRDADTGEGDEGKRIKEFRSCLLTEKMVTCKFSSPHQLASLVQAAIKKELDKNKVPQPQKEEIPKQPPTITWDIKEKDSPYPGLMHFTRKFAPVFFGREAEILEVLDRIWEPEGRFIIVSGNSGTGKSSLVDAGVVPQLLDKGLPGEKSCACVRMVPSQGVQPFDALMRVLHAYAEKAGIDSYRLAQDLLTAPEGFPGKIKKIITEGIDKDELVLFLDQMEELFTARSKEQTEERTASFLSTLFRAVHEIPLRVIATIRGDFLHYLHQYPEMLDVLKGVGHYPLGPLAPHRLDDVIEKPACCAGLTISPSLVNRLIQGTGSDPGSLPYLAFALQRLYMERDNNTLSEARYDAFGGIEGAIGDHVVTVEKDIEEKFGPEALKLLPKIFQSLLVVNIDGEPTRRWALKANFAENLQQVVDLLIHGDARLLRTEGVAENSTVSVAHEKLFISWPALAGWITDNKDDLLILRQAELEAGQWQKHAYHPNFLWHAGRHKRLQGIIAQFKGRDIPAVVKDFAAPQERLVEVLKNKELTHLDRQKIGDYLAELGDPRDGVGLNPEGLPQFVWCEVPPGEISLENVKKTFVIKEPFYISKYPVTWKQYRSFLDAPDGYGNKDKDWWDGLAERQDEVGEQYRKLDNHPAENVSWYDAMAFCFWLSSKLGFEIRLLTEWEWQQAATGGNPANEYPWGPEWDGARANTHESDLRRTTAVGMYHWGKNKVVGVYDMSGNVEEWCLNAHEKPARVEKSGEERRCVRGGSWCYYLGSARTTDRFRFDQFNRFNYIGFRVCCFRPPSSEILFTESRVSGKKGA